MSLIVVRRKGLFLETWFASLSKCRRSVPSPRGAAFVPPSRIQLAGLDQFWSGPVAFQKKSPAGTSRLSRCSSVRERRGFTRGLLRDPTNQASRFTVLLRQFSTTGEQNRVRTAVR